MFYGFRNIHSIILNFPEYKLSKVKYSEFLKNKTLELGIYSEYGKYLELKSIIKGNKDFGQLCAKIDTTYKTKEFILAEDEIKDKIYKNNIVIKIKKLLEVLTAIGLPATLKIDPSRHFKGLSSSDQSFTEIILSLEFEIYSIPYDYMNRFKLLDKSYKSTLELEESYLESILESFISPLKYSPVLIKSIVDESVKDLNIVDSIDSFNKILE